jgi:hypothetical protein
MCATLEDAHSVTIASISRKLTRRNTAGERIFELLSLRCKPGLNREVSTLLGVFHQQVLSLILYFNLIFNILYINIQ